VKNIDPAIAAQPAPSPLTNSVKGLAVWEAVQSLDAAALARAVDNAEGEVLFAREEALCALVDRAAPQTRTIPPGHQGDWAMPMNEDLVRECFAALSSKPIDWANCWAFSRAIIHRNSELLSKMHEMGARIDGPAGDDAGRMEPLEAALHMRSRLFWERGENALYLTGHDLAELLISMGADPQGVNGNGRPAMAALWNRQPEMLRRLRALGAAGPELSEEQVESFAFAAEIQHWPQGTHHIRGGGEPDFGGSDADWLQSVAEELALSLEVKKAKARATDNGQSAPTSSRTPGSAAGQAFENNASLESTPGGHEKKASLRL